MEFQELKGKRIKVLFSDTKARGLDPGWKNGEHENEPALWTGTEGADAILTHGTAKIVVPERYVRPVIPTVKGQHAVDISHHITGQEWYIIAFTPSWCTVRRREDKASSLKDRHEIQTRNLAVIA